MGWGWVGLGGVGWVGLGGVGLESIFKINIWNQNREH